MFLCGKLLVEWALKRTTHCHEELYWDFMKDFDAQARCRDIGKQVKTGEFWRQIQAAILVS